MYRFRCKDIQKPGIPKQVGLLHPALKFAFQPGPFFQTPREYMDARP